VSLPAEAPLDRLDLDKSDGNREGEAEDGMGGGAEDLERCEG